MIAAVMTGFFNILKTWPADWVTETAYAVGDIAKATTYNSHTYLCTTAGTSDVTEPTWGTTNGGTTSDGTVTWTCYDMKTYAIIAPQGSTVPYITFGLETDRPLGTFQDQEAMEDATFWVNTFSETSTAHVSAIADLVLGVLDDSSLTVSGYTSMKCVREFIGTPYYDTDTGIFQIPLRYRVWIDKD